MTFSLKLVTDAAGEGMGLIVAAKLARVAHRQAHVVLPDDGQASPKDNAIPVDIAALGDKGRCGRAIEGRHDTAVIQIEIMIPCDTGLRDTQPSTFLEGVRKS